MTQPPEEPSGPDQPAPDRDPWVKPAPQVEPTQPPYGPPTYGPPTYGPPTHGQPAPYGYGVPLYGYGQQNHSGATTAMWLGIGGLACLFTGWLCCVTIPGVLALPAAWIVGASAKRRIDAEPGRYANRGQAVGGLVMGIIGTILTILVIVAVVLLFAFFGATDSSFDGSVYGNV